MIKIIKLSDNKIMVKMEVPIMDIDRKIGTSVLKIRYKKSKYGKTYEAMMNGTKSSPQRGLSKKYYTKMNKIHIEFEKHQNGEFEGYAFNSPDKVSFKWDDGDRKRWRNKQLEILLKD